LEHSRWVVWDTGFLIFTVWFINLYNFMDGMDGFAGGMGTLGFGFLAYLGWLAGQDFFALSGLLIAGANLGFLLCNFPPARIFMGDAGSTTMGFLAAGMSLWGVRDGLFPMWIPILIFSPFIVDATVTLIRRLVHGDKVWQAHRSHYYQRLVLLGGIREQCWWSSGCWVLGLGCILCPESV
jgi:UDP-N-acetylmuramyl pentapeptide phosphotransferase/UDP-N-acetylglucosamine-1-phosphate transferase